MVRLRTNAFEWEHFGCPKNHDEAKHVTVFPPEARGDAIPITVIYMLKTGLLHL